MKCPICNSKLKSETVLKAATIPSGDKFQFKQKISVCDTCGFGGPMKKGNNVKEFNANRKLAIKSAIKRIVSTLHQEFNNLLYIERALDLPRRTLSRWKNSGESSTSSLLLLKMVETFPFLVDVAEHCFDKNYAVAALQEAARNTHLDSQTITTITQEMSAVRNVGGELYVIHERGLSYAPTSPSIIL